MKRIVTIQDISCLGKCSVTVALPIISAMGVETVILPTAVLSTHTMFKDFTVKDLTDQLVPITDHWKKENVHFDAIYTGYLGSTEEIEIAKKIFEDYKIKHTPVQWALRWLWNQPEVTCVLSGMNSLEMVRDNVGTASDVKVGELGEDEENMLAEVVKTINSKMKVGCTGCRYCMPCPKNVDIPGTFSAYNRRYSEGKKEAFSEYFMCTALRKESTSASNCIECGKCEMHCPQGIKIREELKNARKELEGPLYKAGRAAIKLFKAYK